MKHTSRMQSLKNSCQRNSCHIEMSKCAFDISEAHCCQFNVFSEMQQMTVRLYPAAS